jgi:non-specific serine/threonine protein kinase
MAAPAHDAAPRALPAQLTSFVGRERDLAELARVLADREGTHRLVTLVGPAGVGKTRLALELAARLGPGSAEIALVELAPLVDPDLLPRAVAAALGVREQPGEALVETIAAAVADRRALLLLDNCEHLVEACAPLVERLLRACPRLRVLATSRERLDVPGEATHRVTGLALPAEGAPAEEVARSEAGRLFLERARLLVPELALDQPGAAALAAICRRLDGIPLAIELAATAARALALGEIAARLDDRFRLLGYGGRTAVPRHRTLRAAIDWSHQLLDDGEQALFRGLAVFVGGFALDAVEAVHGSDALPRLLRLVDKSLVVAERRGAGERYRMLETIRQYAEEKLVDAGEAAALRDRHRDWFLGLAERGMAGLIGPRQLEWLDRIEEEHDNLRAALSWCQADPAGAEQEERLASALGRFWSERGYLAEGSGWLAHAAARRPGAVSPARGQALGWAGLLEHNRGESERGLALLEEGVAILRRTTARVALSLSLRHLVLVGVSLGEDRREVLLEEALANARAAGDRRETGLGLIYLARRAISRGDVGDARRLADEALVTLRGLDPASQEQALATLGLVALAGGDHERARTLFQEALELARRTDDRMYAAEALGYLSDVARARGDLGEARRRCSEAAAGLRASQYRPELGAVLVRLAGLEAVGGDARRAARWAGACDRFRGAAAAAAASGWPQTQWGWTLAQHERDLALVRGRLAGEAFAAAFADGQALELGQALDEALALPTEPPRRPMGGDGPLTPREREVAALVAEGWTNRQIAERLVVVETTAERHVANILNKLGFHSRAQIAAWHERGRVD